MGGGDDGRGLSESIFALLELWETLEEIRDSRRRGEGRRELTKRLGGFYGSYSSGGFVGFFRYFCSYGSFAALCGCDRFGRPLLLPCRLRVHGK